MSIHHSVEPHPDLSIPDPHQDPYAKTVFGFWTYLMTDCILFAVLFSTYAVLKNNTFGGVGPKDIFSLKEAYIETMILLFSSVTCGFAVLATLKTNRFLVYLWLAVTFFLGISFVAMELNEFHHLVEAGHDWTKSAFLSSFFTLVGTHGLHVSFGLLWCLVLIGQISYYGITTLTFRRLALFSLFWHFLDVIWIFIFTFVYLMGVP